MSNLILLSSGVDIFFHFFPLFCAILVIYSQNPLWSILSFIGTIIGSTWVLFFLQVEFLTFIFLLVYIGAIAILFLFLVMMLELAHGKLGQKRFYFLDWKNIFYFLIFIKLYSFLFYLSYNLWLPTQEVSYEFKVLQELWRHSTLVDGITKLSFYTPFNLLGGDSVIFLSLFTQKYYFFLIVGFILLFAMVGAISLCIRKKN